MAERINDGITLEAVRRIRVINEVGLGNREGIRLEDTVRAIRAVARLNMGNEEWLRRHPEERLKGEQ